jgi:hypothetical protein
MMMAFRGRRSLLSHLLLIPGSFARKVRQKARAPRKPIGVSAGVLLESRGSLADELGGADVALVPVLRFQFSLVKKH